MKHHRDIETLVDRHVGIDRSGPRRKTAASQTRQHPVAWRRIVGWLLMVALLGTLFQMLAAHFQDDYVSFILTVLPVVSLVALIRPQTDRRHHRALSRASSGNRPHRI